MIYLDNSATTRPFDSVIDAMDRCMRENYFNASAAYKPAVDVDRAMRECRRAIAAQLGIQESGVIFTGGGTESDNLAILGVAETLRQSANFVCSAIEHPAVAETIHRVEQMGHTVRVLPIDVRGVVDLAACETVIDEQTALVSCMQVSNETGAIQPVEELAKLARRKNPNVRVHVDGVQGFLRVPLNFNALKIQSYAFSGHKIHASKGIGGLIFRKDHKLSPIVFGGGQEDNLRSGTENVPGIIGLGEAVRTYPQGAAEKMMALKTRLLTDLQEAIPTAKRNGPALDDPLCAPHILSVSLSPVRSQTMLFALEGDGIYVSAGSACAAHKQKVSGVLTAMGLSPAEADCTLRFSLCPDNTEAEMDDVARCVKKHYDLLKAYVRR